MELVEHGSMHGLLHWFCFVNFCFIWSVSKLLHWSILDHMRIGACGAPFCAWNATLVGFIVIFASLDSELKMSGRFSRTIYVGNLPLDIKEVEVEDLFYKYGRILDIELKIPPRPPCYCFVEFDNARDAEDAIRGRDGYNFDGCRLRVELAHGGRGPSSSSDRRSSYGGSGGSSSSGGRFGVSRHSEFRVVVRGLPSSASWQDLKDHMRKAGDVCFAEVSRDGEGTFGLVDYTNYDDMKYAIRKLDDTEFRNPWTRTYIRVKQYRGSPSRSGSRSCSRSRSPPRKRSKSAVRSASRSPPRSRSASPMKSPKENSRSGSASPL